MSEVPTVSSHVYVVFIKSGCISLLVVNVVNTVLTKVNVRFHLVLTREVRKT